MILIKGGRVIDPKSKTDCIMDMEITDGKITRLGQIQATPNHKQQIDAKGKIISPGFVDIHVHFREPGFTYKEDIDSGARSAAAGGYTTVVCMANTKPVIDTVKTLEYVLAKGKEACIEVLSVAAVTKEFNGAELTDLEALAKAGAIGFTDDGMPLEDDEILYQAMLRAKALNKAISLHEEDPKFITRPGVNAGPVADHYDYGGAPAFSEYSMIARDCMLAVETGVRLNIQHISTKEGAQIVGMAQKMGGDIWAEVTPQHFSATEELVMEKGALAKLNPPLRTEKDRQAIIKAMKEDIIKIIATDHAPHSREEKSVDIKEASNGMIGLETALGLAITNLVKPGHLDLSKVIEKLSINPAQFYNLDRGYIEEGHRADLVIIDPDETWVVDTFHSKADNSPFIGMELQGKIKYTISNGMVVYNDSSKGAY